jgi:drug/metabolite transporter (DMT)-like permease
MSKRLGIPLVAGAAALWGTDALFRRGLALELPASTVVFYEHVVLLGATLPWLLRWRHTAKALDYRDWLSLLVIGVGASATATFLFTSAFTYGDPNTPLLLQKLQPLIAVLGARLVLKEALLPRYWAFFLAGVFGAYLIAFPDPTDLSMPRMAPALLAIGAAGLWGMGTVLGRRMSTKLNFQALTAWRFTIGLPASWLIWAIQTGGSTSPLTGADTAAIVLLAMVPGLAAMLMYYRGLTVVPASTAALAELAFPLSATAINYLAFGSVLTSSQWLGLVVLAAAITTMGVLGSRNMQLTGVVGEPVPARSW